MFTSGTPPVTPLDWVAWLGGRLAAQRGQAEMYHRAYDSNDMSLQFAQEKFSEEFGSLFTHWRDDFSAVVVDSISERLKVQGFRFGDSEEADEKASEIWRRNYLDSESNATHVEALATGIAYLWVWADKEGDPVIHPESATDMIVQYAPGTRREIVAALKKYYDDWGVEHATLLTPKQILTTNRVESGKWAEPKSQKNPLGVVPVVPVVNRQRLRKGDPYSELHPILPLVQAVRKVAADALVASEMLAYPQRLITGIQIPEDADGNPVPPIQSAIDRLLMFEDENVSWGAFPTADLQNYVNLINMLVAHISVISRVPPHLFLVGASAFPSGEALATAEAGLVAKARERMLYFGEAWERAMRLAFMILGDARADAWNAETIWADPEHRSDSMRVDALVKLNQGLNVPQRQLWEDYGYSPETIARFDDMIEAEQKKALAHQKELAALTGQAGGQAPAGNGTKAVDPNKKPQGNTGNVNRKTS